MDDPITRRVEDLRAEGFNDITVVGASSLIPPHLETPLYDLFTRQFPLFDRKPMPPPTRREKLRYRWNRVKRYVRHLGLALVNRCDRESDYWD